VILENWYFDALITLKFLGPGVWYAPVIPAMQEAEAGGLHSSRPPGEKVSETQSQKQFGVVVQACGPHCMGGRDRRIAN
jgi:hypothetical protein